MRKFKPVFFVVLFLLIFAPFARASVTPEACSRNLEKTRHHALRDLSRLEKYLNEAYSQDLKSWETVYNPLWMARLKKEDRFSATLRAEGEMLYGRYRTFADDFKRLAANAQNQAGAHLESFKKQTAALTACCPVIDAQECLAYRRDEVQSETADFEKLLAKMAQEKKLFAQETEQALSENPSEHPPFGNRYAGHFERWDVKLYPEFLVRLRTLREKFEVEWPGEKCCAECTADRLGISQDPVLNALRPDPQGAKGASGKLVNGASVTAAFKEYDQSKAQSAERKA